MANLNLDFYKGIDCYSDGDAVEQRLMTIAKQGHSIDDVPDDEIDFATLYHFSHLRENILNWYPFDKSDHILEIGAGCGAISGILCEMAGSVTAVELSYRRSEINYERHCHCDNLEIFVGNLNDMVFERKFDYVILNGVFEYAASFTAGETPYSSFLQKVISLMVPSGKVLIAIENRLGMKYFSGAPEDHLDGYFTGINGYEQNSPVRTFSKSELESIVGQSGLSNIRFYYPYPDYKFPKEIFTDESLSSFGYGKQQVNLNPLRRQFFREEDVDVVLAGEGNASSIVNSFLIEASAEELEAKHIIYAKTNTDRANEFRQVTTIWEDGNDRYVVKRATEQAAVSHIQKMGRTISTGEISAQKGTVVGDAVRFAYIEGKSVGDKAIELIRLGNGLEAKSLVDDYLAHAFAKQTECEKFDTDEFKKVFGSAELNKKVVTMNQVNIDLIPDNIFEADEGYVCIDAEWVMDFPIPVAFVIWRTLNEVYARAPMMEKQVSKSKWMSEYEITEQDGKVFREWEIFFTKSYVKSNLLERYNIIPAGPDVPMIAATLFYDTGSGYNEKQKIVFRYLIREGRFFAKYSLPDTERPIVAIRWDPTTRQPCKCKIGNACDDKGNSIELEPVNVDETLTDDTGTDFYSPNVEYEVQGDVSKIKGITISGTIKLYTIDEMLEGQKKIELKREKPTKERRPVDIVVPVYNAYEELCSCVESVMRHTDLEKNRIIFVNDASPDDRIAPYLDSLKGPNIIVHHNEGNKGFSANVNYGFSCSQENDVLLLNTDTIVTAGWLDKISDCAARDEHIASVTPLSNAATLCSIPEFCEDNKLPEGYTVDSFAELVEKSSMHLYPRITVAVGFCMYIKREVISLIGDFDAETFQRGYGEENDFCNRAMLMGYYHVMCDDTFIFHSGSASFNAAEGTSKAKLIQEHDAILRERYPDLMHQNDLHVQRNPNAIVQQNIWLHLALDPHYKTIFFVSHRDFRKGSDDSVGGVQLHVMDMAENLRSDYNVVVAARNRETLDVTAYHKEHEYTMHFRIGEQPVTPRMFDPELYELFKMLMKCMGADLVHIQHVFGLSLEPFYAAKKLGLPIFCTLHDYYYICPRIKLMDLDGNYCGVCLDKKCDECINQNNDYAFSVKQPLDFVGNWRREMHAALGFCEEIIAPSHAALKLYGEIFPDIAQKGRVINHGVEVKKQNVKENADRSDQEFNVAFLGGINRAKGSRVAIELIKADKKTQWHIIGGLGDKDLENMTLKNLTWTGWYDRANVADVLAEQNIDLVCIPSVWPETFCYTVSEASECGIPVLCFDVGAQGERVNERGIGWTVPLGAGAKGMQSVIDRLRTKPDEYYAAREKCLSQKEHTNKDMISVYDMLYNEYVDEMEKHATKTEKLLRKQTGSHELQSIVQRQQDELNRIEYSPGYHTLVKLQKVLLSKKIIRRILKI